MAVTIRPLRLTDEIETGAMAYPSRWSTTRLIAANGKPHHNRNWSRPIGRWDISGVWQVESARAIHNLHMISGGMADGFEFRDPADFRAEAGEGVIVNVNGTMYCGKTYTSGAYTYTRVCKRIISGSATLLSGASINYGTGVVTGADAGEACTFQFLKAVAFDTDELPLELMTIGETGDEDTIRVSGIGLIEIPED